MSLDQLRRTWEALGRMDPMWAVLSDPRKIGNRWDPGEFFQTGEAEIQSLFRDLDARSLRVRRGRCLDFGCGLGRLSQALCAYFDRVDGVDIAESMVDLAVQYNRYGERCRYHVNSRDDLGLFDDSTFDFLYSTIVLQHIEPVLAARYVTEFMRVLAPGGVAVFQVPSVFIGFSRLPDDSHLSNVEVEAGLEGGPLETRAKPRIAARVRNLSSNPWPTSARVRLGNHWLSADGTMLIQDDGRAELWETVDPGDDLEVDLVVCAPAAPGRYILELDLVEEGVAWFAQRGSQTCRIDVEVVGPPMRQRVAKRLNRFRPGRWTSTGETDDSLPVFEMHAVPKPRIIRLVEDAGGEMMGIEDCDVSGPGWENYRYFARKN